jgi:hypothetical protein
MRNLELTSLGYRIQTREDLQNHIPAAFAVHPHPERTERYSFVSTIDLLDAFEKLGWTPYSAKQHGQNEFGRHIIRLTNSALGNLPLKLDQVIPHFILDNSHDGYTPASLHLGIMRLACTNGLVVAIPGMSTQLKFRHINVDKAELMQVLAEAAEQYRTIGNHIELMQIKTLTMAEKLQFAMQAVALREPSRFLTEDGKPAFSEITSSMDISSLLLPLRDADNKSDLWTVFNLIQEKTMKGLYERKSPKGKKSSPREITNAARALSFNKVLWSVAEEFMGTKADVAAVEAGKLYNYRTAKGDMTSVEVLSALEDGKYQVKAGNRVFVVPAERLS